MVFLLKKGGNTHPLRPNIYLHIADQSMLMPQPGQANSDWLYLGPDIVDETSGSQKQIYTGTKTDLSSTKSISMLELTK